MLLIDRENSTARTWSHVLSSTDDLYELERFRQKVGAPKSSLQKPPEHDPAHLDLRGQPRFRALAIAERDGGTVIRIYPTTRALVEAYHAFKRAASESGDAARVVLGQGAA